MVRVAGVEVVEPGVDRGARRARRVRDAEREPGAALECSCRPAGCPATSPTCAAVGGLVDAVAPEGRPEDLRVLRVHDEVGRAVELVGGALAQRPARAAVGGLPDAVRWLGRGGRAVVAAAAAERRGVHVVRVGRVDRDGGDGLAGEQGRDVRPGDAAVGGR